MARTTGKSKAEIVAEQVAVAVGAGRKLQLESVDFSDPNRPKTCLEVDFPILPINQIAQIEGNAGKPIYQMSKWWARRRSSVFRATLIAAAAKAPDDPAEASKRVWESYYANHQNNSAFKNLKVADIFMGGGTTLVEGARLGFKMSGNDLNPVAWLIVKNELANVDHGEVKKLFDYVESEVKSQIMPFYACDGPNGEKGKWLHIPSGKVMPEDFDPLALQPELRKEYKYDGPEIIYSFWSKHGLCSSPGCDHRTPLLSNPIIAVKELTVKAWIGWQCSRCRSEFDIENEVARMAPDAHLIVSKDERPYALMDSEGFFVCPHCGVQHHDPVALLKGASVNLPSKLRKNKKISLSLVVHPSWMRGETKKTNEGELGGTVGSDLNSSIRWYERRSQSSKLIEIRGEVPPEINCPDTGEVFSTSFSTVPKNAHFVCQQETCGKEQKTLESLKHHDSSAAVAPVVIQGYSHRLAADNAPYGGRFFKEVNQTEIKRFIAAETEWNDRCENDLKNYWPRAEIPYGLKAHIKDPLPKHGYKKWTHLFNSRQLLLHSLLIKTVDQAYGFSDESKDFVVGAIQQYLAYQNMFCFWHRTHDHFAPFLSNNNLNQKNICIEVGAFSPVGYGPWRSAMLPVINAIPWMEDPSELVPTSYLEEIYPDFTGKLSGKSQKVYPKDRIVNCEEIYQGSSTDLQRYKNSSFDLVVTDPPFSGLFQYAEFADFFYVWLRLTLKHRYPDIFGPEFTPKTLEAVSNEARNPEDPDGFYKRLLTECWGEAYRILKPGGILVFTFHHSEDEPWVDVLESLFDAGFYLEATYPVRSDETKGEKAQFGSQKIEYDIIHVCRKRTEEPTKISWPRLRRQIMSDVRQLQNILEHHQNQGLPKADIQVIKRGKALEYFSRHYGQVYVEEGREFTVREALVGINQILDDQAENEAGGTPVVCEPLTRQFLRIFAGAGEVPRDQMQKYLRGTGIGPSDFVSRDWCSEIKKAFHWTSPLDFALEKAEKVKSLTRDFDQAMLLVGACYPDSGISVDKKILTPQFKPHPALNELLVWLMSKGKDSQMRQAAIMARQLYSTWASKHKTVVDQQMKLFDLEGEV